ncbi:MAG: hypothetical protein ACT4QG_14280 [Sporichthyaceae bacterium]
MSTTETGRRGRYSDADLDEARPGRDPMARASIFFGVAAFATIFVPSARMFGVASCVLALGLALRSRRRARRQGSEIRPASLVLAIFAAIGLIASVTAFGSVESPTQGTPIVSPTSSPDGKPAPVSGVVGEDIDVVFGTPRIELDEFGLQRLSVPMTITNKTKNDASFDFDLEARTPSGELVTTDTAYVPNLAPGQSAQIRVFNFVNEKLIEKLAKAEYSVASAVKY